MKYPAIFYPGWLTETSKTYTHRIAKQTPNNSGVWGKLQAVENAEDAAYAICQDNIISIKRALSDGFSKSQIIYIKREADKNLPLLDSSHQILSYQGQYNLIPSVWWIDMSFNELLQMPPPKKCKSLSAIVSATRLLEGHKKRLNFLELMSNYRQIDFYGRGHVAGSFNNQYKGALKKANKCKSEGLFNYEASFAIENCSEDGYITEKFNDCVLSWSIPIYYGAANASSYFPDCFVPIQSLDVNDKNHDLLDKLDKLCYNDYIRNLAEARERILLTYNLWAISEKLIMQLAA